MILFLADDKTFVPVTIRNNFRRFTRSNDLALNAKTILPLIYLFELGLRPIYEEGKEDAGIIRHSYADTTRSKGLLHFVVKKDIDKGLNEIAAHMNHNVTKFQNITRGIITRGSIY